MATQISDSARELFDLLDVNRFDHIETKRLVGAAVLDKQAQVAGLAAGLRYQHEGLGAYLVVERSGSKRDELKRHSLYAIACVGSEIEAAEQLARAIAEKHGPGLWWDTGGCVGYCGDDGKARAGMLNGEPHVVLRAYYFHDPACPAREREASARITVEDDE